MGVLIQGRTDEHADSSATAAAVHSLAAHAHVRARPGAARRAFITVAIGFMARLYEPVCPLAPHKLRRCFACPYS